VTVEIIGTKKNKGGIILGNKADPHYNASGCKDLTAYSAIRQADQEAQEQERINHLIGTIFYICNLAGYRVGERIVLTDKRTGKTWR
jgi:hypothetical protein